MKQTHRIHVCLIISLIHYFDKINLQARQDLLHFDSIMNPTDFMPINS